MVGSETGFLGTENRQAHRDLNKNCVSVFTFEFSGCNSGLCVSMRVWVSRARGAFFTLLQTAFLLWLSCGLPPLLNTECPVFKMLGAGIALDWGLYFEIFEYLWDIFGIGSKSKHEFHLYLSPEGHLHTSSGPSAPLMQSVTWKQGQIFHFWHLVGSWEVLDFRPSQILQFWIRNDQPYYNQQIQNYVLDMCRLVL